MAPTTTALSLTHALNHPITWQHTSHREWKNKEQFKNLKVMVNFKCSSWFNIDVKIPSSRFVFIVCLKIQFIFSMFIFIPCSFMLTYELIYSFSTEEWKFIEFQIFFFLSSSNLKFFLKFFFHSIQIISQKYLVAVFNLCNVPSKKKFADFRFYRGR